MQPSNRRELLRKTARSSYRMRSFCFALVGVLTAASCGNSTSNHSAGGGAAGSDSAAGAAGTADVGGGSMNGGAQASAGGAMAGGSGTSIIACDWESLTTASGNEKGVGDGCTSDSQVQEIVACPGQFCISRPLFDRWPVAGGERRRPGHCTKHCATNADCGSGARCCEPQRDAFCMPYEDAPLLQRGCSELCATNYLACSASEICCERIGKLCVLDSCSGVCPDQN